MKFQSASCCNCLNLSVQLWIWMELVYLYIPCFLYYVERLQNAEVVFMYVKYMTHFQFCGIMHIGTHSSMYIILGTGIHLVLKAIVLFDSMRNVLSFM